MKLTPEQIDHLVKLLTRSKRYLSDAASPSQIHAPNYASLAADIEEAMEAFGIESYE